MLLACFCTHQLFFSALLNIEQSCVSNESFSHLDHIVFFSTAKTNRLTTAEGYLCNG